MPRTKHLVDIGAEAALIAGGGRAILLQLANPAVGHGVAAHSDFVSDPLRRLRNTLTFVYALVYGSPEEVDLVRNLVAAAHAPVRSSEGEKQTYDASDPELQLWVAATLYDSAVVVYQRLVGPLTEQDLDAIYREYAIVGTALGMPATMWPADRLRFAEYWREQSQSLRADDTVRRVAGQLLHPRSGPLWMMAGMPLVRLVTAGLLTQELREQYRMPWSAGRARRYGIASAVIRFVYRLLPRAIRHRPKDQLLRRLTVSAGYGRVR